MTMEACERMEVRSGIEPEVGWRWVDCSICDASSKRAGQEGLQK